MNGDSSSTREHRNILNVRSLVRQHHAWRAHCLNLMDAENVMSPLAREFMSSDFHHRYPNYDGTSAYRGNKFMEEVDETAKDLARRLFSAKFVELHAFSGTLACLAVLFGLTNPGDLVLELEKAKGGFATLPRLQRSRVGALIRLRAGGLPFDPIQMNIDGDAAGKIIRRDKPTLVILGATLFLFPHPLETIVEAANEVGALVAYDGSHVLGLVAGGEFQDPIKEGAFILMGSTHKTFPGPQSGLILSDRDDEMTEMIVDVTHRSLVGNHHHYLIPGLAVALAEMIVFGGEYARQTIKNSKALGQALYERGFDVLCADKGFTESHEVIIDVSKIGGGHIVTETLEKANIIATKSALPWDSNDSLYTGRISGLRFGTQEVTRLGMRETDMTEIAGFCERVLLKKEKPSYVVTEVERFCDNFQKIHFSFDSDSDAYKYYATST